MSTSIGLEDAITFLKGTLFEETAEGMLESGESDAVIKADVLGVYEEAKAFYADPQNLIDYNTKWADEGPSEVIFSDASFDFTPDETPLVPVTGEEAMAFLDNLEVGSGDIHTIPDYFVL